MRRTRTRSLCPITHSMWSGAQSLISLSDVTAAILEMKRVLRPGGLLAVLENDIFHHVLLPWPVELELPVQKAIQKVSRNRFGSSSKLSPVRRLPHLFDQAGFLDRCKRTFAADRTAAWSSSVRRFLEFHVIDIRRLVAGHLTTRSKNALHRFTDLHREGSLFRDKAVDLTCLNVLYQARKPRKHHA